MRTSHLLPFVLMSALGAGWWTASAASVPPRPTPTATPGSFSNRDLRGRYAFYLQGDILSGQAQGPLAAVGIFVADGNGDIPFATRTLNAGGMVVQDDQATGTYSVDPDGLGVIEFVASSGDMELFEFTIVNSDHLHAVPTGPNVVGWGEAFRQDVEAPPFSFDNGDFHGDYATGLIAQVLDPLGDLPVTGIGFIQADGLGNLFAKRRLSVNGVIIEDSASGTYSVSPNGMGNALFTLPTGEREGFDFVIVTPDLQYAVATNPSAVGIGPARRR